MIDRRQFEECYCPQGKDPNFPQNWIRKKYVLDYPEDMEPPYPSDGDLNMIIHKSLLVDNLDNYSIGVYLRLILLTDYGHYWKEIFNYGAQESIQKALLRLQQQGYIEILADGTLKMYV